MAQIETSREAKMRLRVRFTVDHLLDRLHSSLRLPRPRICLSEESSPVLCMRRCRSSPASIFRDFQVLSWTAILSPVASACRNVAEENTQSLCESASYMQPLTGSQQSSNYNSSLGFLHLFTSVLGHTVWSTPNASIII